MPSTILSDNGVSSGSAGLKTTASNDGILVLQTSTSGGTATNAVYIDTSQNVGVGTTSPSKKFVVSNGGAAGVELDPFTRSATTGGSLLAYNRSGAAYVRMDYDASQHLFFLSGTQSLTLNSNGALALLGGVTNASGVGIAFPATQSASSDANTLDDYEEGSWTCSLSGSSGSITLTQTSRYTKIGNLVMITAGLGWSGSTLTGQIIIGGFPFALNNSAAGYRAAASFGYVSGITFSGQLISDATAGNTQAVIFYAVSNSSPSNIAFQSSGNLQFTLVYQV